MRKVLGEIYKHPNSMASLQDALACVNVIYGEEKDLIQVSKLRSRMYGAIREGLGSETLYDMLGASYRITAKDRFEDYMIALEWDRPPEERFYLPRKQIMTEPVQKLQDMIDGKLDFLLFSFPPRVGKTSLLMFLLTMLVGRNSESSNLYSAYSDYITRAMYAGVLEVIRDDVTYNWGKIFTGVQIANTNGDEETINIERRKRYASLTCRSLYGTLNGACDCNGFLIADDLIGGIEEALSRDRLASAIAKVQNNLLPRRKEGAKTVFMGTRWSMADPIGVMTEMLENDPTYANVKYAQIVLPALNEDESSNFDYKYGVGFSTDYYKRTRAMFERNNDMPSWFAQYQGEPIERVGALFNPEDMKTYNGELPDGEPDRVVCVVDPAWGGGDAVAAPIAAIYGNDVYIVDVVYSFEDKTITQPMLVSRMIHHGVTTCQIECTKMTDAYRDSIGDLLRQRGVKINLTGVPAPNNTSKEARIMDSSPNIRDMYFLEDGKRTKEYSLFMQNVFSFKLIGKNKHDDAPDSLAQLAKMLETRRYAKIEVSRRIF